ncbi:DUF2855 family protein [Acidovorax sp. sic0104]|uniref:DUF2855 family protein n=1 Tax=Acidovorax sp. sic0104 TaxID=2854784 RepID=UPI001C475CF8|nr:DUF2855 family protein [Acidovorax sp. sic0104]MBV7541932.1 DUF2855 family protein [Acidovorax sp. sic0104]
MSITIYHDVRVVSVAAAALDASDAHLGLLVLVGDSRSAARRWVLQFFAPEQALVAYAVASSCYFRKGAAAWKTHRRDSAFDAAKWITRVRKAIAGAEAINEALLDRTLTSCGNLLLEGRFEFEGKTIREALKAARDHACIDTGEPSHGFVRVYGPDGVK